MFTSSIYKRSSAGGIRSCALALLAGWALAFSGCHRAPASAQLREPILVKNQIAESKSLYFTQPLGKEHQDERASMFAQAARDARLWRQLDRRFRFDTAVLMGDPSFYRPLLLHLRQSPDWVLAYLDHTAIVYKRAPANSWDPASLKEIDAKFADSKENTVFKVQAAGRLMAIGNTTLAKELLDHVLDPNSPEVLAQYANLHIHLAQWREGLQKAEQALKLRGDFAPALSIKAQLLLAAKRPGEAFECSRKLISKQSQDPDALFLHARIAHAARAFQSEIEVLEQLIKLAEGRGQSATGYRIYLGQAYAADSRAQPAIEQFEKVSQAADATDEQRHFATEFREQIRKRSL